MNMVTALRAEIVRVARKEIRAEVETLRKASVQHRSAIAQLRRQVSDLERQLKQAKRASGARAQPESPAPALVDAIPRRFSATRLAAHRAKLGLSAAAYGKLVGMSGATIYLWEQGRSRPNAEQLQKLAEVRTLPKSEISKLLGA